MSPSVMSRCKRPNVASCLGKTPIKRTVTHPLAFFKLISNIPSRSSFSVRRHSRYSARRIPCIRRKPMNPLAERIGSCYDQMSQDELAQFQSEALRASAAQAAKSPYYSAKFKEIGLDASDIKT